MVNDSTTDNDAHAVRSSAQFARRDVLRGTASVIVGGLGVTGFVGPAAAVEPPEMTLTVLSTINLESEGNIPVELEHVQGDSPCLLPVDDDSDRGTVVEGPRLGPPRLFQCDTPPGDPIVFQQTNDANDLLCALREASAADDGATLAHAGGHPVHDSNVTLHFPTQQAGFEPTDIENGMLDVMVAWAVDRDGDMFGFAPTDQVKGVAPMF